MRWQQRGPNSVQGCTNRSTDSRSREIIIFLYFAFVRPYPEYQTHFFGPLVHKKSTKKLRWGSSSWLGPEALVLWGEAEGHRQVQHRERTALGAPNSYPPAPLQRLARRWSQPLHSTEWQKDKRQSICWNKRDSDWI